MAQAVRDVTAETVTGDRPLVRLNFFEQFQPGSKALSALAQTEPTKRTEYLGLFVEPDLRALLETTARENERSMSAEARLALRHHLAKNDRRRSS